MSSTSYRALAEKCLDLAQACSDRRREIELTLMAAHYFEKAKEQETSARQVAA